MKKIDRMELVEFLNKIVQEQNHMKPTVLFTDGDNDKRCIKVIEETLEDSVLSLSGTNLFFDPSYYIDNDGEIKEVDYLVEHQNQHCINKVDFDKKIRIVVYHHCPFDEKNLHYFLNVTKAIRKPVIILAHNSNIDSFPMELATSFEQMMFEITKERWLQWARTIITDNKDFYWQLTRISSVICDFIENNDESVFESGVHPDSSWSWSPVTWEMLSAEYRRLLCSLLDDTDGYTFEDLRIKTVKMGGTDIQPALLLEALEHVSTESWKKEFPYDIGIVPHTGKERLNAISDKLKFRCETLCGGRVPFASQLKQFLNSFYSL